MNPLPHKFKSVPEFESYLASLGMFRMTPGLERISACLDQLGLARLPYPGVQIIGTNGKGSTASFLAQLAGRHGLKAGLYTSPHFLSPRERVLIVDSQGKYALPDDIWLEAANQVHKAGQGSLSYFEFLTALAALAFQLAGVDVAVFEAGLGGTYDATTALDVEKIIFTSIDYDHEHILGRTLDRISADKAGAIRAGQTIMTFEQAAEVMRSLRDRAGRVGATVHIIKPPQTEPVFPAQAELALRGPHQLINAGLALAGWQALARGHAYPCDQTICRQALQSATIPGRLQIIPDLAAPETILDAAHNQSGLASLRKALASLGLKPATVVFACLADKNLAAMRPLVLDLHDGPILVPELPANPRARAAAELAASLGPRARPAGPLAQILDSRPAQPILICGSIFLLAEFYKLFPNHLGIQGIC